MVPYLSPAMHLERDGWQLGQYDLKTITAGMPTPYFLYDPGQIERRYRFLTESLGLKDNLLLSYAMKANFHPRILRCIQHLGGGIDAVSPAEIILALKAGILPERILFTGNSVTEEALDLAKRAGVDINLGSLYELEKFGALFPGADVCLRINTGIGAGEDPKINTGGRVTKFGIHMTEVAEAMRLVSRYRLRVVGLHEHTGSGISDVDLFMAAMSALAQLAERSLFPDLVFLNFGGGFTVPYRFGENGIDYPAFGARVRALYRQTVGRYGGPLRFVFEPGKYLTAESGILVTKVCVIKQNGERWIAGTDSGFPHLHRPILYGAYHEIINISNPNGVEKPYDITGNICETGDRFAEGRRIPEIRPGDLLGICNAGAYARSMASQYNLRPLPAEYLIEDGSLCCITKAVSPAELAEQIWRESTL